MIGSLSDFVPVDKVPLICRQKQVYKLYFEKFPGFLRYRKSFGSVHEPVTVLSINFSYFCKFLKSASKCQLVLSEKRGLTLTTRHCRKSGTIVIWNHWKSRLPDKSVLVESAPVKKDPDRSAPVKSAENTQSKVPQS